MNKLLTVIMILLGISTATLGVLYNGALRERKVLVNQMEQKDSQIAQKDSTIKMLGELESVHCSISFVVNNKAVFGSIKNGDYSQIAEATLTYLRKDLIANDTLVVNKRLK